MRQPERPRETLLEQLGKAEPRGKLRHAPSYLHRQPAVAEARARRLQQRQHGELRHRLGERLVVVVRALGRLLAGKARRVREQLPQTDGRRGLQLG